MIFDISQIAQEYLLQNNQKELGSFYEEMMKRKEEQEQANLLALKLKVTFLHIFFCNLDEENR